MTIDLDLDVKQSVQIETIGPITERQNRLVGFFQWLDKIVLFLIFVVLILMSLVDHLTFGSHSMKICINTKFYWSSCCFCRPRKRIKSKILFSSFLLLGLVFFSISKMKSTLLILWIVKKKYIKRISNGNICHNNVSFQCEKWKQIGKTVNLV